MIWNVTTALAMAAALLTGAEAVAQDEGAAQAAAEAAPAEAQGPLWLMSCSNQANPDELPCEFSQSLVVAQGNQRLATASFSRSAGKPATRATMTVPVGVALSEGVSVAVDDKPVATLPYDSCDGQGCYASAAVDEGWLAAMRAGKVLTATVRGRDGGDIALGFQLQGFSKAEAMLP